MKVYRSFIASMRIVQNGLPANFSVNNRGLTIMAQTIKGKHVKHGQIMLIRPFASFCKSVTLQLNLIFLIAISYGDLYTIFSIPFNEFQCHV